MTGREVILKSGGDEKIAESIEAMGYVCVPREPTEDMLAGAYYDALEEDAKAVWDTMIGVAEGVLTREGIAVR